jgi:thiamine biosynthesis lipoprotein
MTRRKWRIGAQDAHHIINPRTLAPAVSPVFSASVTAATAVEAEAGAKAVLLRGESGLAWAERQSWIDAALVVWHDGNVFATSGWEMAA